MQHFPQENNGVKYPYPANFLLYSDNTRSNTSLCWVRYANIFFREGRCASHVFWVEANRKWNSTRILLFATQHFKQKVLFRKAIKIAPEHETTLIQNSAYICGKSRPNVRLILNVSSPGFTKNLYSRGICVPNVLVLCSLFEFICLHLRMFHNDERKNWPWKL